MCEFVVVLLLDNSGEENVEGWDGVFLWYFEWFFELFVVLVDYVVNDVDEWFVGI